MVRMERVNQQLKREISLILQQELSDPRFSFVTITAVNTSKDLRSARVYFSSLGRPEQIKEIHQGLRKASKMVRYFVGQRLNLRYTPELNFFYDNSLEVGAQIEETLQEIQDDTSERPSDSQET